MLLSITSNLLASFYIHLSKKYYVTLKDIFQKAPPIVKDFEISHPSLQISHPPKILVPAHEYYIIAGSVVPVITKPQSATY